MKHPKTFQDLNATFINNLHFQKLQLDLVETVYKQDSTA